MNQDRLMDLVFDFIMNLDDVEIKQTNDQTFKIYHNEQTQTIEFKTKWYN